MVHHFVCCACFLNIQLYKIYFVTMIDDRCSYIVLYANLVFTMYIFLLQHANGKAVHVMYVV